ncbi:MAG: type 4a pilus biogenesis protein PilO [Myxococcota bacterium]|jgi:Tfp pilus assembly protein PilO|nr:type 4a pilus biogenesis protein PilO [Myxococcota bacterium]
MSSASAGAKKKLAFNIPPLQIALGLLLLMVVLGGLFYFFMYRAKIDEIKKKSQELTVQTSEISRLESQRVNLLRVQERATRLQKRLDLLRAKLPSNTEELNDFLSSISQRAQNARVAKWVSFQQGEPEPFNEVSRIKINMSFLASFDAATQFFWEISAMGDGVKAGAKEQIVNVQELSMVRATEVENRGLLKVDCVAETYLYDPNAAPPEEDKKGRRSRRGGRK